MFGYKIILNSNLVIDAKPIAMVRTWKERLFTRPWKPFLAIKMIKSQVPDPNGYFLGNDTMVMHPITAERLKLGLLPVKDACLWMDPFSN
jgi:hypothetical protein